MRRGLSFILVVLLVLRGLLGDAMAMGTAPVDLASVPIHQQTAIAAKHDAAGLHQSRADAHALATATTAGTSACTTDDLADAPDCGHAPGPACSACGICHSALSTIDSLSQPLALQPFAAQPVGRTLFASAAAALAIKPPIS